MEKVEIKDDGVNQEKVKIPRFTGGPHNVGKKQKNDESLFKLLIDQVKKKLAEFVINPFWRQYLRARYSRTADE